jgi:hypothetical protein
MACRAYRWPATREEVLALVGPVLARHRRCIDAAAELGCSDGSLRSLCRQHGIDITASLARPPVTGAVSRQGSTVEDSDKLPANSEAPLIDWTGARPQSTGAGLERRLIGSDTHIPFHDLRACAAFLAVARALQPHRILLLGDTWNMGAVSRHPRPFGGRESHESARIQGLSFLGAIRKAAPGAELTLLLGNHCDWGEEFEDQNPQFAGMFSAKAMGIDRLGWTVVPRELQPLILGPVAYEHGSGGGEHYAKRYALHEAPKAGVRCYVVGHHHSMQHHRAKNGCECWGAGWLGSARHSAFDYAKKAGDPDHWELGCLVQDVIGERVTTTPVRLEGGAALVAGRLVAA